MQGKYNMNRKRSRVYNNFHFMSFKNMNIFSLEIVKDDICLTLIWVKGGGSNFGFQHFAAFSNILLETFVPNLVFLTRPSPQINGQNPDRGISDLQISG